MSDQLTPALLIPYDATGESLEDDRAIALDFNPESLSLQVQVGEEAERHRLGNQQTQHVAKSTATLSFDAVFDTTRPNPARGGADDEPVSPERLDVRIKTAAIAAFLQAEGEGENSAPRRVRFHWGNVIFDGLIKSFRETLEYFSAEGVPLRSKLSLSLTEQDFRYNVDADQVQRAARTPGADQAGAVAAGNDLDSLFDLSAGAGFKLDVSLDLDLQLGLSLELGLDADVDFGLDLGFSADVDFGASVGVDFDLSAGAAVDLFGGAAIQAALGTGDSVDLGRAVSSQSLQAISSPSVPVDPARPPNAWAPDGPQPGSRASKLAARVQQSRAGAASTSRERRAGTGDDPASTTTGAPPAAPLPVRGSPPTRPASFGPQGGSGLFPQRQTGVPVATAELSGRPAWEGLAGPSTAPSNRSDRAKPGKCCVSPGRKHGQY